MSNSKALEEKEKGNKFFKERKYEQAVQCYSKAIEYDTNNHLLYGNRSQAYLNLDRPLEAVKDCNQALELDSNYIKGYLRRGTGFKMLSDFEKALSDFKKVLQLEPSNNQATKEIQSIEGLLSHKKIQPISSTETPESNYIKDDIPPSGDNKQTSDARQNPRTLPVSNRVISRIPVNSFEFYCDWRELSSDSNKLNYISNIGPIRMGKIFTNSMEPLVFCNILRILTSCNDISFRSNLILELSKMAKFATLVLFLEDHEERILKDLIMDMRGCISADEMDLFIKRVGQKFA